MIRVHYPESSEFIRLLYGKNRPSFNPYLQSCPPSFESGALVRRWFVYVSARSERHLEETTAHVGCRACRQCGIFECWKWRFENLVSLTYPHYNTSVEGDTHFDNHLDRTLALWDIKFFDRIERSWGIEIKCVH